MCCTISAYVWRQPLCCTGHPGCLSLPLCNTSKQPAEQPVTLKKQVQSWGVAPNTPSLCDEVPVRWRGGAFKSLLRVLAIVPELAPGCGSSSGPPSKPPLLSSPSWRCTISGRRRQLGREGFPFGWLVPPSTRNHSAYHTFLSTVNGRSAPLPVVGMPITG